MLLFIDLETSGLIRKDVPLDDASQPWAIKIAVDHTDGAGKSLNRLDVMIKPEGRKVKEGAEAIHGIDDAVAERFGLNEPAVLAILADLASKSRKVISYGSFDRLVVEGLMMRLENKLGKPPGTYRQKWLRPGLEFIDLMVPHCQQVVQKPGKFDGQYGWPKLDESIAAILGETPDRSTHDAFEDMTFVKRIYFALRDRGHFDTEAA
jgi:DNA polymerase-3 subunit epsilon